MRPGLLILLLLLAGPATGSTSHGVALLIVNRDYENVQPAHRLPDVRPLARALVARGFTTTISENLSRDDLRFTIEQFAKTAPTNGVALIYFAGYLMPGEDEDTGDVYLIPVDYESGPSTDATPRDLGTRDVLNYLNDESGASISFVLLDGSASNSRWSKQSIYDRLAQVESADNIFLNYVEEAFAGTLTPLLNDRQMNPVTAIRTAASEAGGWSSEPSVFAVPAILSPVHPPGKVSEGNQAGDEWVNALGTVFAWCPARSSLSGKGNEPGFWLGKYEMTRREFDLVTRKKPRGALASQPNHPRDAIRYDDILLYVEELNRRERFFNRLPGNWEYALPTDAEWEYASRAGSKTRFYFGSSPKLLPAHANFADRNLLETGDEYYHYADGGLDDGSVQLAPVGSYRPNPWGFHDLYGNLWEWTASSGERTEQQSPVARGCSWVSIPAYCDSSFTHRFARDTERNFIGFRLALRKKLAQPAP